MQGRFIVQYYVIHALVPPNTTPASRCTCCSLASKVILRSGMVTTSVFTPCISAGAMKERREEGEDMEAEDEEFTL